VWLTPEQGGRGHWLTATAGRIGRITLQPLLCRRALVRLVCRRSFCGDSMLVRGDPRPRRAGSPSATEAISFVEPGSVVVVTEGTEEVAFFIVGNVVRS
jgi:hypothetical protein